MAVQDNTTESNEQTEFEDLTNINWRNAATSFHDDEYNADIHILGTTHIEKLSVFEAEDIVNDVQPHALFLELCPQRKHYLQSQSPIPDREEEIQRTSDRNQDSSTTAPARRSSPSSLMSVVASMMRGDAAAGLFAALAEASTDLGGILEVVPGTEFRAATRAHLLAQTVTIPLDTLVNRFHIPFLAIRTQTTPHGHCIPVFLGDRPVSISLKRLINSMSWYRRVALLWDILFTGFPNEEEILRQLARLRDEDVVTGVIKAVGEEYPELIDSLLTERNIYMGAALKLAVMSLREDAACYVSPHGPEQPIRVVAIIGRGHINGVKEAYEAASLPRDEVFRICQLYASLDGVPMKSHVTNAEKRFTRYVTGAVISIVIACYIYNSKGSRETIKKGLASVWSAARSLFVR